MKKTLFSIFTSFACFGLYAQTFTTGPNDTIAITMAPNQTEVLYINQLVNTPGDTLQLEVEILQNNIPHSWDGMFCIQGLCTGAFAPVGSTFPMTPIHDNLDGYGRLTISPLGNTGTVTYQAYIYDINQPNLGDTATWIVTSSFPANISEDINNNIRVYPNPATDLIYIESQSNRISEFNIFDNSGKLIYKSRSNNLIESISTDGFAPGIYVIEGTMKSGERFRKRTMVR